MSRERLSGLLVLLTVASVPLVADTVVMRDGRRVSGTLVSVRRRHDRVRRAARLRQRPPPAARPARRRARRVRRRGIGWRRWAAAAPRAVARAHRHRAGAAGLERHRHRRPARPADLPQRERRDPLGHGRPQGRPGRREELAFNQGRPIPNRPAGALIGRVGDSDAPFFAGSDRGPYEMRGSGRLYLGVNDDYLQDNSGTFRVVVSY